MKILSKKIAIVGATGAVGRVFLDLLNDNFPGEKDLFLLASKKSEGKKISCGNQEFIVEGEDFEHWRQQWWKRVEQYYIQ